MWEPDRSQESKGVRGAKKSGERRGLGERSSAVNKK